MNNEMLNEDVRDLVIIINDLIDISRKDPQLLKRAVDLSEKLETEEQKKSFKSGVCQAVFELGKNKAVKKLEKLGYTEDEVADGKTHGISGVRARAQLNKINRRRHYINSLDLVASDDKDAVAKGKDYVFKNVREEVMELAGLVD